MGDEFVTCANCGADIPSTAKVCGHCGQRVARPTERAAMPPPDPPASTGGVRWGMAGAILAVLAVAGGAVAGFLFLTADDAPPEFSHACDVLDDAALPRLVGDQGTPERTRSDDFAHAGVTTCEIGLADSPLHLQVDLLTAEDAAGHFEDWAAAFSGCPPFDQQADTALLLQIFDCVVLTTDVEYTEMAVSRSERAAWASGVRAEADYEILVATEHHLLVVWRDLRVGELPEESIELLLDLLS